CSSDLKAPHERRRRESPAEMSSFRALRRFVPALTPNPRLAPGAGRLSPLSRLDNSFTRSTWRGKIACPKHFGQLCLYRGGESVSLNPRVEHSLFKRVLL